MAWSEQKRKILSIPTIQRVTNDNSAQENGHDKAKVDLCRVLWLESENVSPDTPLVCDVVNLLLSDPVEYFIKRICII